MTEDPIAPARGIARGLIVSAFLWVVIFAVVVTLVLP